MLGLIGGAMKALNKPKKPKETKVNLKKFTGAVESTKQKAKSEPKGAIVPTTMKIVEVKAGSAKSFNLKGENPIQEQFLVLHQNTFAIKKALENQTKVKKKRAKQKKSLFEWFWRKQREEDREDKDKGIKLKTGIGDAIATKAKGIFDIIMQIISTLFAGWLLNYIPVIIALIKSFGEIVEKVVNFIKPIVKFFWTIGHWIVKKGVQFGAMLAGVDSKIAQENSIIQNLNEIQKQFPLIEAAAAAFLVFKTLRLSKKLSRLGRKPPTPKGTPRTTGAGGKLKTSSSASKLVRSRHGTSAQRIYDNAIKNGKSVVSANAEVQRALDRGRIVSKPDYGLSTKGKQAGKILKGGPLKSVNRAVLKLGGRGSAKVLQRIGRFIKLPFIGSLIVAVTQLLAGEPLGKALFMGIGAGLGGILGGLIGLAGGPLSIVSAILGEMIGTFVGELLYLGIMKGDWAAAGQKFKETLIGLWDATGGALLKWMGNSFKSFIEQFKKKNTKFGVTNWLALLRLDKTVPMLYNAFFPKGEDDGVKRNILGIPLADQGEEKEGGPDFGPGEGWSDVQAKPRYGRFTGDGFTKDIKGSVEFQKSSADSIGHPASYDTPGGDTVIANVMGDSGGVVAGGGGHGSSTFVGGNSFDAAALNRKASNLAKLWA